ncbi:hypothetical protein C3L23_06515 [Nautilia sp. PV-1]|nr:hypothetical protein C3L23_06515 [Nautilia sp. PV-1]
MKTSSTSIKAIIFTIMLFLFIIFISLFKGIYLYNINIKNIHIKSAFFKIDNKIVLKINDIKIKNSKNYTKQVINIHKTAFTIIKFLNIFQTITINYLEYGKTHINKINLIKNNILFDSPFLYFKAVISPNIKNSYVNFSYLKIPQYDLAFKNTVINIFFHKNSINFKGEGKCNNNKFKLNALLTQNNILNMDFSSPNITYENILFNTDISDLYLKIYADLNNYLFNIKGNLKKAKINFKNIALNAKNSEFTINIKTVKLHTKELIIPKLYGLDNVRLENSVLFYNIHSGFLIADAPALNAKYKNYKFKLLNSELIFKNPKNLNLQTKTVIAEYDKNRLILTNNLLNIFDKYTYYSIDNGRFENRYVYLKSSKIFGNLMNVFTNEIKGKVFSYKTDLHNIKADIKHKSLHIKNAEINNVKINKISFVNKKLSFHSKALFNKNIKEILHRFLKITIPVTQIAGENNITSTIDFSKEISSFTHVKTKLSLLKLFDFDLFVPMGDINITNTRLNFYTQNAQLFLQKDMPLKFTGSGLIDFLKEKLLINGKVDFEINKIIKLKDYNETAIIDFNTNTLRAKNSSVYIDFDKKMLIINQLNKVLKYTPFEQFVKNGLLLMTFSDTTDITTYLLLKLPILYKHTNKPITDLSKNIVNKIFLNISISKKQIDIFNNNIDINVKNNNINVKLINLDINLYPLETLLLDSNDSNEYNYTIKLYANNANLMYKQHKFLSQTATVMYKHGNINFHSIYKHSSVKGYTKQGYLLLEGKNFSNEEFRAFLPKFDFFSKINLDFIMVKSPDNFYTGKIYINSAIVRELKSLNNIIAFINTIPSLLSFSSPGFSSKGYKIRKGYINYLLYKKILYIKDAKIYGDNLDFFAKGYIDFNKNYMFLKITANMKMKLKKIPIIGKGLSYLLFGKDGSINIKMIVKGDINNPKVKEDIGKDILISPFTLFKRAITLPFNLF